jgi:hypothetical protein
MKSRDLLETMSNRKYEHNLKPNKKQNYEICYSYNNTRISCNGFCL